MLAVLQVLLGAGVSGLTQSIGVGLAGAYTCFIFLPSFCFASFKMDTPLLTLSDYQLSV